MFVFEVVKVKSYLLCWAFIKTILLFFPHFLFYFFSRKAQSTKERGEKNKLPVVETLMLLPSVSSARQEAALAAT